MNGVSTKVSAATLGAALSTLVWTLLAAFVHAVSTMSPEALTGVTGATAVLAAFGFGFLVKETATTGSAAAAITVGSTTTLSPATAAGLATLIQSPYGIAGGASPAPPAPDPGDAWDSPAAPPSEDAL